MGIPRGAGGTRLTQLSPRSDRPIKAVTAPRRACHYWLKSQNRKVRRGRISTAEPKYKDQQPCAPISKGKGTSPDS